MNITVKKGPRSGIVSVPSSKSAAHRLLICAALSNEECGIKLTGLSKDITATMDCLKNMGAGISAEGSTFLVRPVNREKASADTKERRLYCGESGSTLRFLLPVCGALGISAVFHMEGRLPERPMTELTDELVRHGMKIEKEGSLLHCSGRLSGGQYAMPGNISSQYISGLLFALPLLDGDSVLTVTGTVESKGYIDMTEDALASSGIRFAKEGQTYYIPGQQSCRLKGILTAEADWSSAAFFLVMGAFSKDGITVSGLNEASSQGDKAVLDILIRMGARVTRTEEGVTVCKGKPAGTVINAENIPDLVPVLSVAAAGAKGETVITNAKRLRMKESDRLAATFRMLGALGADIKETEDGLIIHGKERLKGGSTFSFNDHRIAMSAAAAASICENDVLINEAQCTEKSYPGFFDDLEKLSTEHY